MTSIQLPELLNFWTVWLPWRGIRLWSQLFITQPDSTDIGFTTEAIPSTWNKKVWVQVPRFQKRNGFSFRAFYLLPSATFWQHALPLAVRTTWVFLRLARSALCPISVALHWGTAMRASSDPPVKARSWPCSTFQISCFTWILQGQHSLTLCRLLWRRKLFPYRNLAELLAPRTPKLAETAMQ